MYFWCKTEVTKLRKGGNERGLPFFSTTSHCRQEVTCEVKHTNTICVHIMLQVLQMIPFSKYSWTDGYHMCFSSIFKSTLPRSMTLNRKSGPFRAGLNDRKEWGLQMSSVNLNTFSVKIICHFESIKSKANPFPFWYFLTAFHPTTLWHSFLSLTTSLDLCSVAKGLGVEV